MHIGLDFGTTNSSVSLYDGTNVTLLPLDSFSINPKVMRTTLFIMREFNGKTYQPGARFIGREAIDRFIQSNVGRQIEYAWQNFGETEIYDGGGNVIKQALGAMVDQNIPGRLFQSLKSHLRDVDYIDTEVFGERKTLEALIAIVLRMIRTRVEDVLGTPVTRMVIGRPVNYSEDPQIHAAALARMRLACQLAELPEFAFLPEPNAAALLYALRSVR
jgi:hypothetical chaperone protein